MLRYELTHPQILPALAAAGHGAQILLADANYPLSTATAPAAARVHLNLTARGPSVTEVLEVIGRAIYIEAAYAMQPDDGGMLEVHEQFRELLGEAPLAMLPRHAFYAAARGDDVVLAICCGERRHYANLLLTIAANAADNAAVES